jgi:serine protease Do
LRKGDVIIGYGGQAIDSVHDLTRRVADTPAGRKSDLVVWRDRSQVTLEVEIARLRPEQVAANEAPSAVDAEGTSVRALGARLAPLTPATRADMGLAEGTDGVVITDVDSDGAAAAQGLRPGDIIEQVGPKQVSTPADVAEVVNAAIASKQLAVLLLVNRDGNELFVAVKVGQA